MVLCVICFYYQKLTFNKDTHYWQPIKTMFGDHRIIKINRNFGTQTHTYELVTHSFSNTLSFCILFKTAFNGEHLLATSFIDDNVNRLVEDGQVVAIGASGEEDWSLLRVWSGRFGSADGYLCANCSLVGLYMVSLHLNFGKFINFCCLAKCSTALRNCFLIVCEWLHGIK